MKIRCRDGVVRDFEISKKNESAFVSRAAFTETVCTMCGKNFGVHDMKAIKHLLLAHTCREREKKT